MFGIARKSLDAAGGAQLAGQQGFVTVDGAPVAVRGDPVTPHGAGPHAAPAMAEGSGFVSINGIPVVRAGRRATRGHASTGAAWVRLPS